ncbi:hypothetical protein FBZ93_12513 [Bradyrhizobium macuxiense]|uniref:Uncharacterized protein n=1 Tax=Bradyrhizobium macuxiense TaxID=1755647 RepID=A0A560KUU9_9BRAD|nr:hypothetical protein FBZ93_12513 [Bradyrhizobium macuxiense]
MFEVYLNDRRDFLVVTRGSSLPGSGMLGRWTGSRVASIKLLMGPAHLKRASKV